MKTATDRHWSERATSVADDVEVNIMDVFQRELEHDLIEPFLKPKARLLEVGCGNGFSTQRFRERVEHVDAFDFSAEMVDRARARVGETNNRFLHDDILAPRQIQGPYDAVVCVRVLINLASFAEQAKAVENIAALAKPGGQLILAEGFREGFDELSRLRRAAGMSDLRPAAINFYSSMHELEPEIERYFAIQERFHLGAYDYLTRVVYPLAVGEENVAHNTVISERFSVLARAFNPDEFAHLSRMQGLVCTRLS